MAWIDVSKVEPSRSTSSLHIIEGLVFNCPSSTERKEKDGSYKNGKPRYKTVYKPVSARETSFRRRGINGSLLVTLLVKISSPLKANKTYRLINSGASVEKNIDDIMKDATLSDPYFDVVVYQKRSDMTDVEAFYYYIRNAFAHGAFEVLQKGSEKIYKLESAKDGKVKAQMRLKESTLEEYIRLANLSVADIKALQRPKKKKI